MDGVVVYQNTRTRRLMVFSFLLLLALGLFVGGAWGTRINDPSNAHGALLILAALMVPVIALYDLYLRHAVTRIIRKDGMLHVTCAGLFKGKTHSLKPADIRFSGEIAGRGGAARHVRMHVTGWRWPGIIDVTQDRLLKP